MYTFIILETKTWSLPMESHRTSYERVENFHATSKNKWRICRQLTECQHGNTKQPVNKTSILFTSLCCWKIANNTYYTCSGQLQSRWTVQTTGQAPMSLCTHLKYTVMCRQIKMATGPAHTQCRSTKTDMKQRLSNCRPRSLSFRSLRDIKHANTLQQCHRWECTSPININKL